MPSYGVVSRSKLSEYSAKRSFAATPEPAPKVASTGEGPLLFVVQQHRATRLHYDFRLECDGVLKSWAVPKGPSLNRDDRRLAVLTEDHPYDYASFEGVIPPGQYGAGEVIVWDCGVYSPDEEKKAWIDDRAEAERQVRAGLEKGKLSVFLRGAKLKGSFALVRTRSGKEWLLIKHRDRFASGEDVTLEDRSPLSNVAVAEMKRMPAHRMPAARLVPAGERSAIPAALAPMHAESADAAFVRPDWMWEPKLDGYRVLAFIDKKQIRLLSRKGLDLAKDFPQLCEALMQQGAPMILDGEVVAFDDEGKPSFHAMQNRGTGAGRAAFYAFDLLHFGGIDLRAFPYRDRRRYMEQCLLPSPLVQLVHAQEDGVALARAALESGFEGVIGKRMDSRYEAGRRSSSWLKVKPVRSADFVIGGYTAGKGARAPLGALLVGTWEGRKLRYASHVGSGFDDESLVLVRKRLEPLVRKTNPFSEKPELNAPTTWVEPKLVAEVEYHSFTPDGHLRAPVFLRLRDDIESKDVVSASPRGVASGPSNEILQQLETKKTSFTLVVGKHTLKLTHLDRVYWPAEAGLKQPALTKRDLLRYLVQVSPHMLPHLAQRPLTMIRMPEGIGGERFYQKHWRQEKPKFVETLQVFSSHNEGAQEVLLCNNLPTLLWLAQSGTLEFHVWHSRATRGPYATQEELDASELSNPDFVVFDIDPYIYSGKEKAGDEPELNTVAFEKGKEVAFRLRELLNGMNLEPVVKTSGKTGLHVFVPIRRTIDFDAAKSVSELVGRHLLRKHPKDITMDWKTEKRTGKIFIDHNMNVRGKTLNAAYSPRGAAGAPVSMPLSWEELEKAHPLDFTIANAARFLAGRGDRWRGVLERKQSLEKALKT